MSKILPEVSCTEVQTPLNVKPSCAQEERDEPVDVQIGPQLYEHAPQELRSRLWIALLDNSMLANSVEHSAVSADLQIQSFTCGHCLEAAWAIQSVCLRRPAMGNGHTRTHC